MSTANIAAIAAIAAIADLSDDEGDSSSSALPHRLPDHKVIRAVSTWTVPSIYALFTDGNTIVC